MHIVCNLTVNIDALRRGVVNVLLSKPCDQVLTYNRIKCPPLMTSCHLLTHSCQKALRVEKTCHPEHLQQG